MPPPLVDKNGKPISPSFLGSLLGTGAQLQRSGSGQLNFVKEKKHRRQTKTPYGAPIKPALATAAGLSPVPEVSETSNIDSIIEPRDPGKSYEASETPAGAKAVSTHESLTSKGTDETASANSDVLAWSAILDSLLVGMRAQGRSWQEIHEVVPHKSIDDIKERAKYLHIDLKGEGKEKSGEASDSEESIKSKGKGKQAKGKGKEPEKKVKFTKPEEESEPEEDSSDEEYENDSDASATDPGDFPVGWPSPVDQGPKKKGVLRIVEADPGEEEPTEIRGRPIVYMQPEDQLTPGQMQTLFSLTRKNDDVKWLEVASRFFDRTGRRLDPELLKAMLNNL